MNDPVFDILTEAFGDTYRLERELPGGGMSRVFVLHDKTLSREIVVKILSPALAATISVERFRREILMAAGLQHPNIVPVLAAGEARGLPYLSMPYVDGESLAVRLGTGIRPTTREIVSIMRDVARALAFAHERGVVHRDIKPGNILLSAGAAVVTDFGVAKALSSARSEGASWHSKTSLTGTGISLGTYPYMAPEQALGDPDVDARADLYSLGATAYEMITGTPPFADRSPRAMLAARVSGEMPSFPETASPALVEIIKSCLAGDPSARPSSAGEVIDSLDAMPTTGSAEYAAIPRKRPRRKLALIVGALVVAAAVALGAWKSRTGIALLPGEPAVRTLAIMPFTNIGPDSTAAYLAAGMTSAVASTLVRAAQFKVIAPNGQPAGQSPVDLARKLNATLLLQGEVQRSGDRLRVTAQLTRASDGVTEWSQVYDQNVQDLFATQDSLSSAIASAVTRSGSRGGASTVVGTATPEHTIAPELYDLYTRGQYELEHRGEQGLRRAIADFTTVTRQAPTFSPGWSRLSEAYSLLPLYANNVADSISTLALRAAENAVRLDSTSAHAHAARALALDVNWRWDDAEDDFQRALEIAPRDPLIQEWYGEQLLVRGKLAPAVIHLTRASRLDPSSSIIQGSLAVALARAGLAQPAMKSADSAVKLDPSLPTVHFMRGAVSLYGGNAAAALPSLQRAVLLDSNGTMSLGFLGYAYARAGDQTRARAAMARLARMPQQNGRDIAIARIRIGLADTTGAIAALSSALQRRDPFFYNESLGAPPFASLAGNPAYEKMTETIHLDGGRGPSTR